MQSAIIPPPSQSSSQRRRLVVFVGPPKTGSTTLQIFLRKYARRQSPEFASSAFDHWSFLDLHPEQLNNPKNDPWIAKMLSSQGNLNIVVGSEYFFSPQQVRQGRILELLHNWTGIHPEIVLMLRNPRTSQLVSIWKQQYQHNLGIVGDSSFRDFLCLANNTDLVRARMASPTNPWKFVHDHIHRHQYRITVMDLKFIVDSGLDVSHVFACAVLGVLCTTTRSTIIPTSNATDSVTGTTPSSLLEKDGSSSFPSWVLGLENHPFHSNARKGYPTIAPRQMEAMDQAFLQRDCAYYKDVHNHPLLQILPPGAPSPSDVCQSVTPKYHSNARGLLEKLRRIHRCPTPSSPSSSSKSVMIPGVRQGDDNHRTISFETTETILLLLNNHTNSSSDSSSTVKEGSTQQQQRDEPFLPAHNHVWMDRGIMLFLAFLLLFRRRGCWR